MAIPIEPSEFDGRSFSVPSTTQLTNEEEASYVKFTNYLKNIRKNKN